MPSTWKYSLLFGVVDFQISHDSRQDQIIMNPETKTTRTGRHWAVMMISKVSNEVNDVPMLVAMEKISKRSL